MILWDGNRNSLHGVQTWHEFVSECSERLHRSAPGCGCSSIREGSGFSGTASLEEAVGMARDGWQEGAEIVGQDLDSIAVPEMEIRSEWILDAVGRFPCIPAYLSDDPQCMFQQSDTAPQKCVSLIVYSSYSGSFGKQIPMNYAKGLAAVVRSLEAAGITTAIYVTCAYQGYSQATIVRALGEPLDLAKVAFCMHPSYLRRLYFAYGELEAERVAVGMGNGGYGGSCSGGYLKPNQEWAEALIGPGAYCFLPPLMSARTARVANDPKEITDLLYKTVQEQLRSLAT